MNWRDVESPIEGVRVKVRDATIDDCKMGLPFKPEAFVAVFGPNKTRLAIAMPSKLSDDLLVSAAESQIRSFAATALAA